MPKITRFERLTASVVICLLVTVIVKADGTSAVAVNDGRTLNALTATPELIAQIECKNNGIQDIPGSDARVVRSNENKTPECFKIGDIPVAKSLWGRSNVMGFHPRSPQIPCEVDVSKLTKSGAGVLTLHFHAFPTGDCQVVIKVGGQAAQTVPVAGTDWKTIDVNFNKEPVVMEVQATRWYNEHAFVTFEVESVLGSIPTPTPRAAVETTQPATVSMDAPSGNIAPTLQNVQQALSIVRRPTPAGETGARERSDGTAPADGLAQRKKATSFRKEQYDIVFDNAQGLDISELFVIELSKPPEAGAKTLPRGAYIARLPVPKTGQSSTCSIAFQPTEAQHMPLAYVAVFSRRLNSPLWLMVLPKSEPTENKSEEETAAAALKMAESVAAAGNDSAANQRLTDLIAKYPKTTAAKTAQAKLGLTDAQAAALSPPASRPAPASLDSTDAELAQYARNEFLEREHERAARVADAQAKQIKAQRRQSGATADSPKLGESPQNPYVSSDPRHAQWERAHTAGEPDQKEGPTEAADLLKRLSDNGTLKSYAFIEYFQVPSGRKLTSMQDLECGARYHFSFVTQAGFQREHDGYIIFRRVGGIQGQQDTWTPTVVNIDGRQDLTPQQLGK